MRIQRVVSVFLFVGLSVTSGWIGLSAIGQSAEEPDLAGRWVMVQVMPAIAQLPFLGEIELTTVTAMFVEIEQRGAELILRNSYCFTDVEARPPLIESEVPDKFIASLSPYPHPARMEPTLNGWRIIQPACTEIRGAILSDPENDALPVDAYDPRVFDQDGDERPGMTIPVSVAGLVTGDTYVVHRLRYALEGTIVDGGVIVGRIEWSSEQNVLAATDLILLMSYTAVPHTDPARSVFVMERVDESWSCHTLRTELPRLLLTLSSIQLPTCL